MMILYPRWDQGKIIDYVNESNLNLEMYGTPYFTEMIIKKSFKTFFEGQVDCRGQKKSVSQLFFSKIFHKLKLESNNVERSTKKQAGVEEPTILSTNNMKEIFKFETFLLKVIFGGLQSL